MSAARAFARMLRASGESYEEILRLALIESEAWGPKAKLFVETVIRELDNG